MNSNNMDPVLEDLEEVEEEEARTMPLLGGVVKPEGLPEADDMSFGQPEQGSRILSHGTLLIIGVFVIAAAAIWGMRIAPRDVSGGENITAYEAKIEDALSKFSNPDQMAADDPLQQRSIDELFEDTDAVISMFSNDLTDQQVPVEQLKKNPFTLPRTESEEPQAKPVVDTNAEAKRRAKELQQLERELSRLSLKTVVSGKNPMAIIGSEVVRPGFEIGSFKVVSIEPMGVTLEAAGQEFHLTLGDATNVKQDNNRIFRRN